MTRHPSIMAAALAAIVSTVQTETRKAVAAPERDESPTDHRDERPINGRIAAAISKRERKTAKRRARLSSEVKS